jgi:hypothetical protein
MLDVAPEVGTFQIVVYRNAAERFGILFRDHICKSGNS